jgi:23S rRNA (adenine2503-C2)-methyltransferase
MISFHALSLEECIEHLRQKGEKPFRAKQIFSWIYEKRERNWEEMSNLSVELREKLKSAFSLQTIKERRKLISQDKETVKFLWELQDGKFVESVLILSGQRRTVCVSSQVGCPARCAFCASGKQGLVRNLSAEEIFEQVYAIDAALQEKKERVSHVVFMGMGEPLENYDNVVHAMRLLIDPLRLGLSQRRITLSTVGVVEGIYRLSEEALNINLVLSLHAPNQYVRKKIIPYARKYPLEDVLKAVRAFSTTTGRDVTYEYTLIAGINDGQEHAHELGALLKGEQCSVNLIPYNPITEVNLERPQGHVIEAFRAILITYGLVVTWRYTKGKDIDAACGQLALQENLEKIAT